MKKTWLTVVLPDSTTKDVDLEGDVTVGRAKDNTVVIDHSSFSPYQLILEKKHQNYYLSDLSKLHSTLLNNAPAHKEISLKNGDEIKIGACKLIFHLVEDKKNLPQQNLPSTPNIPSTPNLSNPSVGAKSNATQTITSSKMPVLMILSAVSLVLMVAIVMFLVWNGDKQTQKATEQVHIISPTSGTTIRSPINILVEVKKQEKIDSVIYQLDGVEIAKLETAPYNTTIDPKILSTKFPNLTRNNHILSIMVEDNKGKKVLQSDTLLLAFEDSQEQTTTTTLPDNTGNNTNSTPSTNPTVDVNAMTANLVAQIAQKSGYQLRSQFIEKVRLRTSFYRLDTFNEARRNRREIIKAFRDKGLHPLLGFILAISESKFQASSTSNNQNKIGLWQIPKEIGKNYLLPGESDATLNDPKRGAEITATYLKDLINVFGVDNFIYAIACYGQPLNKAGELRTKLETSAVASTWQTDFWRTVESGLISSEAADQVVNFFAAGIVGENPQAFGIQQERLSSLY